MKVPPPNLQSVKMSTMDVTASYSPQWRLVPTYKRVACQFAARVYSRQLESQGGVMGKINYARVILGGIVAGIIGGTLDWLFNGVLLSQLWSDTIKTLNRPLAFTGRAFLPVGVYLPFIVGGI